MARFRFETDLLVLVAETSDTTRALAKAFARARRDPRFQLGMRVLFDHRALGGEASVEEIERRVAVFSQAIGTVSTRVGVVVDQIAEFGLARVATVHAKRHGATLGVFWDLDEAYRWLRSMPTLSGRSAATRDGMDDD